MKASPTNYGSDKQELAEFAGRVQAQLAPCANCQPCDGGEPVWLNFHTDLYNLMEMLDIPGPSRDEVANRLDCPCCHHSYALDEEVGYKGDVEVLYCELVDAWCREYRAQFDEFHKYLEDFPDLGVNHELGRRIYEMGSRFPTTVITHGTWYKALRTVNGQVPALPDFYPPDPNECPVSEGRFNHRGQSSFYLAGDKYGAVTEVMGEEETTAWVQKFRVKDIKRILDLTHEEGWAEESLPVIAAGLMYVGALNRPVERETGCKPEYLVPRFVADCARARGFEGIAFKSARHYFDNLLLFKFEPENIAPEGEPTIVKLRQSYRRIATNIEGIPSDAEWSNDEPSPKGAGDLQNLLQPARHHKG
jgi:hypothetical protein